MILSENNNINLGVTFSDGLDNYKKNHRKNYFEEVVTVQAIEEDPNLSLNDKLKLIDIINSNIDPFEKRLRIMRSLDKEKDFTSKISLILKESPPKMEMIKRILLVFRDYYKNSNILKREFGEVLTPIGTVKDMIEKIDSDFWTSPYTKDGTIKRVLDCSNGSGIFLWMVIYKFMIGLNQIIIDEEDRYKFIIENIIYACEIQKSKMFNWLCIADLYDCYDLNVYCGSYIDKGFDNHMKEVWNIDTFSLIISNPPYQESIDGNNRSRPLYNIFIEKSIKISEMILFITPSRWLSGGFGLDNFRNMMFNRKDIKLINHFDSKIKIFDNVDIVGGVSYFMLDRSYNGDVLFNGVYCKLNKYDIWVDPKYHNLLDRFILSDNLSTICKSKSFWMNFNDNELDRESNYDNILCYVAKQKGLRRYIKNNKLSNSSKLLIDKYKIFTPAANGEKPNFGNLITGLPNESASNTYLTLYLNSKEEIDSLKSYMSTKFCNFFLSLRKNTQNIKPDTLKWIPMVPFDREWTNEKLFEYFNLSNDEIDMIIGKNRIYIIENDGVEYTESYWYELIDGEKINLIFPKIHNTSCICRSILNDFTNLKEDKWSVKIDNMYYYLSNISGIDKVDLCGKSGIHITTESTSTKYGMDKIYFTFLLSQCNKDDSKRLEENMVRIIRDTKLNTLLK